MLPSTLISRTVISVCSFSRRTSPSRRNRTPNSRLILVKSRLPGRYMRVLSAPTTLISRMRARLSVTAVCVAVARNASPAPGLWFSNGNTARERSSIGTGGCAGGSPRSLMMMKSNVSSAPPANSASAVRRVRLVPPPEPGRSAAWQRLKSSMNSRADCGRWRGSTASAERSSATIGGGTRRGNQLVHGQGLPRLLLMNFLQRVPAERCAPAQQIPQCNAQRIQVRAGVHRAVLRTGKLLRTGKGRRAGKAVARIAFSHGVRVAGQRFGQTEVDDLDER